MTQGARYGPVSTINSGNRLVQPSQQDSTERRREVWEEERSAEGMQNDGYEPVQLGVPAPREWENDTQEYLMDDDQADFPTYRQQRHHPFSRFLAPGTTEITRIPTNRSAAAEDDIVDSYMHRTPFLDAEEPEPEGARTPGGPGSSPEFLSPSSAQTEQGLITSPSTGSAGTHHSSPSSMALASGTSTTGRKWGRGFGIGSGIGLGVPRNGVAAGAGGGQSQMRRRTPSRRQMTDHEEDARTRDLTTMGGGRGGRSAARKRPTLSARSSTTASSTRTGGGWSWLNGLGIAHVFSGANTQQTDHSRSEEEIKGEENEDSTAWQQRSRVTSTNIWGAAAADLRPLESRVQREAAHRGTDYADEQGQGLMSDAVGAHGSQGSRGTIRLVPPSTAVDDLARGDVGLEERSENLPAALPTTTESAPFLDQQRDDGSLPARERGESFSSYESRTSNDKRDSAGFRHAVLAALGFSSGHTRLSSGGGDLPDLGLGDPVSSPEGARRTEEQPGTLSRNDSCGLFSLPPNVSQSMSSGPSQHVGLGIAYDGARRESQFSHPSLAGTWDALYPDHQMDLDLDSDMLDFSSPSGVSHSLSGSGQTSGSDTRSPAMMSTGPMPHSEQFHVEEPTPPMPSPQGGNGWNAEEEKDIALAMATYDSQQPLDQERHLELPLSATTALSQELSPISPKRFPVPPQRQLATSPRGLRPRPSESMLRQPISEEGVYENPASDQVAHLPQRSSIPVVTPTRPNADTSAGLLSPASIYSTNTFGGHAPARQDNPLSPPIVGAPDGSSESWPRARFSHLFAGRTRISGSEPISGNSFSSLQQQQCTAWNQSGSSSRKSGPDEARILQPSSSTYTIADQPSENRWSTVSFPGHPIVSPEMFQNAALGLRSEEEPTSSPHTTEGVKRRRPLPKPISTRSPMEVQRERAFRGEVDHGTGVTPLESADLAMGDASSAAQSVILVRPPSSRAPPSSQAGSFFTAQSSSGSSKSRAEHGETPRESPSDLTDLETTIVYPETMSNDNRLPQATSSAHDGRMMRHRRSKMSNSTSSSSVMATSNLQPLPENLEDAEHSLREEGEMQELPRTISMSAMRGSIPQLVTPEQVFSARFDEPDGRSRA
ncbi:hypothetical protein QFC22_002925 [Naganishia vaughanmartiniae]|uniref:Uncharacterized protein n=1 Tax=Naganishia vaughanmartiniae TaxID=1424756 RepID=A0ACC2X8B2_9TREE|nr:hypothetical protein QFC22_002925 [Naganishia vaughanmartiniae]